MANFFSDQLTLLEKTSPSVYAKPADLIGRIRVAYFTYLTPATGMPTIGDIVALTKVPANSRVLAIRAVWQALTTGVGVSGADFGPANDNLGTGFTADYVAALNMNAAGNQVFVSIVDLLPNVVLYAVPKYICARVTGQQWAANSKVQGVVEYALD